MSIESVWSNLDTLVHSFGMQTVASLNLSFTEGNQAAIAQQLHLSSIQSLYSPKPAVEKRKELLKELHVSLPLLKGSADCGYETAIAH